jgi:hypothetical protein
MDTITYKEICEKHDMKKAVYLISGGSYTHDQVADSVSPDEVFTPFEDLPVEELGETSKRYGYRCPSEERPGIFDEIVFIEAIK